MQRHFGRNGRPLLFLFLTAVTGCGGGDAPTTPTDAGKGASAKTTAGPASTGATPKKAGPRAVTGDRLANLAPAKAAPGIPQEPSVFRFADITKSAGIDFVHISGMNAEKNFPTANGSGTAILDYDGDGKLDLYFASCSELPIGSGRTGKNRLYKNLGDGKFQDVTDKAGVGFSGFTHGAIAGDIDNDGDPDLFLCNFGPNVLYKNNGDGTFADVSAAYGVDRPVMYGWLESGASADNAPIVIDAVDGKNWKSGDVAPTRTLRTKVAKGRRIVVRQAAKDAEHGIRFANPNDVIRRGEPNKPEAFLREVGTGESGVAKVFPPLAPGAEPVVMTEFEVIRDPVAPIRFLCHVNDRAWSSSGAFFDYDNDGDLDLYVSNYGEWILPDDDVFCGDAEKKVRLYCSPRTIRTTKHFLYRNDGSKFTEISDSFLVDADGKKLPARADGHGFCVVAADLNNDDKVDLYVANDMNPNFLFLNKGDGTFFDATETSGAAYDDKGQSQSGMGADADDVNGDGLPELFVTNFANEYNTLYQNYGNGNFMDSTAFFGLAADAMPFVGWGTSLSDFDNDGWPDIFVANGHVDDNRDQLGQTVEYPEVPLLHRNLDGKRFKISTRDVGTYFDEKHVARGASAGDLDDDGDIDLVVNHKDTPPAVLRNDTKTEHHWIRFRLRGTTSNRDAVGAKVVVQAGNREIVRLRKGGCGLMGTNDGRVLVGIGKLNSVEKVTVRWPSGKVSELKAPKIDTTHEVVEP
ncbi:MAG: CRTAC1 family protein [Isosphaeraceae bacterium]|nr:CRTAC1 family protein [Isosphaeraceae bacterium]